MAKKTMLVLIDTKIKERFKIRCYKENVYMSDVVEILIERWLNSKK